MRKGKRVFSDELKKMVFAKMDDLYGITDHCDQRTTILNVCTKRSMNRWTQYPHEHTFYIHENVPITKKISWNDGLLRIKKNFLKEGFAFGISHAKLPEIKTVIIGWDFRIESTVDENFFYRTLNNSLYMEFIDRGIYPIFYLSGNRSIYASFHFNDYCPIDLAKRLVHEDCLIWRLLAGYISGTDNNITGNVRLPLGMHQDSDNPTHFVGCNDLEKDMDYILNVDVKNSTHSFIGTLNDLSLKYGCDYTIRDTITSINLRAKKRTPDNVIPLYSRGDCKAPRKLISIEKSNVNNDSKVSKAVEAIKWEDRDYELYEMMGIPSHESNAIILSSDLALHLCQKYGSIDVAKEKLREIACIGINDKGVRKERLDRIEYKFRDFVFLTNAEAIPHVKLSRRYYRKVDALITQLGEDGIVIDFKSFKKLVLHMYRMILSNKKDIGIDHLIKSIGICKDTARKYLQLIADYGENKAPYPIFRCIREYRKPKKRIEIKSGSWELETVKEDGVVRQWDIIEQ